MVVATTAGLTAGAIVVVPNLIVLDGVSSICLFSGVNCNPRAATALEAAEGVAVVVANGPVTPVRALLN